MVTQNAQPDSSRTVLRRVPNLGRPKAIPRYNKSKQAVRTFWGNSTEPLSSEGREGGPLVTCQNKGDAIPGRPSSSQESAVSTRVSRPNGYGARATSGSPCRESNRTVRRAHGRLTAGVSRPPFAARTINNEGLTDAWNNVNVVVGSKLRAELRMKSGHSFWAKYRETSEIFDLDGLFGDYWGSDKHRFTVLGQS